MTKDSIIWKMLKECSEMLTTVFDYLSSKNISYKVLDT